MPDFERLTDSLKIHLAPCDAAREWEYGYQAGKKRARSEVLFVVVALYFILAFIGYMSS